MEKAHHHPGIWSPGSCGGRQFRLGWGGQPPFDLELPDSAQLEATDQLTATSLENIFSVRVSHKAQRSLIGKGYRGGVQEGHKGGVLGTTQNVKQGGRSRIGQVL